MSALTLSCGIGIPRPSEVIALAIPLPQTLPGVEGSGRETTDLSAPASDTWTLEGAPATIIAREYRLLLDGVVALGPQASPTFALPAGTAGQTYSYQLRVVLAQPSGTVSAWTEIGSAVVSYIQPQALGVVSDLALSTGIPDQIIDFENNFSGSDLIYTVQSGALPNGSALNGSVLILTAADPFGPGTIVIRATNPGGFADQAFDLTITPAVTTPSPFQPGDWTLATPALAGVIEVNVSTLPTDGGATLAALEYRLNGGDFTTLGGSTTGSYQITGLEPGQTYEVALRAVNSIGNAPTSDTKSGTTASVPAAFTTGQWSVQHVGTGTDIRITIAALPDAAGAPLTRLQYDIDAAGWVDFPTAPAEGPVDLLNVLTADQTSQVMIRASNAIGNAPQSDTKSVTSAVGFDLTGTPDSQIEINEAQGTVTVTVTNPVDYAAYDAGNGPGVFVTDVAGLAAGPISLVPPQITTGGPAALDDPLAITPGLWIYDGDSPAPTIAYSWLRDGTPISGATSTTYTVQATDEGTDVTVEETATDANGVRVALSATVSVTASGPTILLTDGFDAEDGYALNDDIATATGNWILLPSEGDATTMINPLGVAEFTNSTSNSNPRIGYAGAIGGDHAVEAIIDSVFAANRADPTLFVRASGPSRDYNGVRLFCRTDTGNISLIERIAGVNERNVLLASDSALSPGDVIRLEVVGTTATAYLNGVSLGALADVVPTGGVPCFGCYLALNVNDHVSYQSVQVEDLS